MASGLHPAHRYVGASGAGYPTHRVVKRENWTNEHKAPFMNWQAACGATGTNSGHNSTKDPFKSRRAELCRTCWGM